ncbi:MAG: hypothetical protein ACLQDY_24405 [Streptosporangiaceae bacterium]
MSGLPFAGGHLVTEALPLAASAREMDGDAGGYLDRLRQDPHDLAIYLYLLHTCTCSEAGNPG